jgi:hypothetical protein
MKPRFWRREPQPPTTEDVVAVLRRVACVDAGTVVALVDAEGRLFAGSPANPPDLRTALTVVELRGEALPPSGRDALRRAVEGQD